MTRRILLLVAVMVAASACSGSDDVTDERRVDAGSTSRRLVYLRGTTLFVMDLESGVREKLTTLPSQDVFPHGRGLAVVEDRGGGEDFAADPDLTLRDDRGRVVRRLGPGYSPLSGPQGDLAFLRSAGERRCEGETCVGGVEVMLFDAAGADVTRLLGPGDWGLLAWAGSDVIVANGARPDSALLVDREGRVEELPFAPNEVWDASDRYVVVVRDGVHLFDLRSGRSEPLPIEGTLAEGTLSGSDLVAVELGGRTSRLIRVSLPDGDVTPVAGSRAAMGPVLRASEGEAFSYVRADGLKLEAVVCGSVDECATALRWVEGVTPLFLW